MNSKRGFALLLFSIQLTAFALLGNVYFSYPAMILAPLGLLLVLFDKSDNGSK